MVSRKASPRLRAVSGSGAARGGFERRVRRRLSVRDSGPEVGGSGSTCRSSSRRSSTPGLTVTLRARSRSWYQLRSGQDQTPAAWSPSPGSEKPARNGGSPRPTAVEHRHQGAQSSNRGVMQCVPAVAGSSGKRWVCCPRRDAGGVPSAGKCRLLLARTRWRQG